MVSAHVLFCKSSRSVSLEAAFDIALSVIGHLLGWKPDLHVWLQPDSRVLHSGDNRADNGADDDADRRMATLRAYTPTGLILLNAC